MNYKIRKAELIFDKDGKLEKIITTAEMFGNSSDVRNIRANRSNPFWTRNFELWEVDLQKILQKTTGHGSEI